MYGVIVFLFICNPKEIKKVNTTIQNTQKSKRKLEENVENLKWN